MSWIHRTLDLFLHLDKHLGTLIGTYGGWSYAILFAIVFCETGLVVTPFLPGDSLLFAAGALSAGGSLDPLMLCLLLSIAAILGDTVNYHIGYFLGHRLYARGDSRLFKRAHIDRTQRFYEKYGGKTIIIARFVPIVRTFAPFVAGVGRMSYAKFITYNVIGGIVWVVAGVYAGYFFGKIPFVSEHFSLVVIGIVVVSILPIAFEFWNARRHKAGATNGESYDAGGATAAPPAINERRTP